MQRCLGAELEKTKRFDLVIISPEQLRQSTGQTAWRDEDALPPDFFNRLREACGCDAVFFTQLTRYYPTSRSPSAGKCPWWKLRRP